MAGGAGAPAPRSLVTPPRLFTEPKRIPDLRAELYTEGPQSGQNLTLGRQPELRVASTAQVLSLRVFVMASAGSAGPMRGPWGFGAILDNME